MKRNRAESLSPRKKPQQRRSLVTIDTIFEATIQVLLANGLDGITTIQIAERAGVSVGSLYQYFPNKDAILVALTQRHLEEGYERIAPILFEFATNPPPIDEGLTRLVEAMLLLHSRSPRLHRVLFEECPRPPELQERFDDTYRLATEALQAWLAARPEVKVPDRRLAAEMVAQVVESTTHGLVIHPQPDREPSDYTAETVRLLTGYLTG